MALTKITTSLVAVNSLTSANIADNSIDATKIAQNNILARHIPNATALVLDGGVTIDNITIDGTEIDLSSGDLSIDVAGDIILDADGGDFKFRDGGTNIGYLSNSSSDFAMEAQVQDKDIIFKGNDNGAGITALTLDMSEAGDAHFNRNVGIGAAPTNGGISTAGSPVLSISGTVPELNFVDTSSSANDYWIRVSDGLQFGEASDSRMYLKNGGNLGIGTTSPAATLHILTSTNSPCLIESTHGTGGYIELQVSDGTSAGELTGFIGDSEALISSGTAGDFAIRAQEDFVVSTGGATERFQINSSGNVGIGTTDFTDMGSSSYKGLKVGGAVIQDSGGGNGSATWIGNNAYVGGSNNFYFDGGGAASGIQFTTGDINFHTFDGGGGSADAQWSPTARMHIKENGYIGIGTTSPSTKLYVYNAGGGSSDCMTVQSGSTANSNVGMIIFRDNDQDYCGQITTNGSTNTAIYNANTSDERLKENITDWEVDALSLFKNIEPKEFNFKSQDEGAPKVRGYIAQTEVSKFPEAFTTDSSEEAYYSYNPGGMVIYLMKALKEQVAINEALEARITALE